MGQVVVTKVIEILVLGVLLGWLKTPDELIPVDLDIEPGLFVAKWTWYIFEEVPNWVFVPKRQYLEQNLGSLGSTPGSSYENGILKHGRVKRKKILMDFNEGVRQANFWKMHDQSEKRQEREQEEEQEQEERMGG